MALGIALEEKQPVIGRVESDSVRQGRGERGGGGGGGGGAFVCEGPTFQFVYPR